MTNMEEDMKICLDFKNGKQSFRTPEGNLRFKMIIAGDCCPWESTIETIRNGNAAEIIAAVKPFLDTADLKIIQFESPLTEGDSPIDKSGPNLKCPPECLDLVRAAGFDAALLANNHTGDHGPGVVLETIKHFGNAGIKTAGAGKNLAEANSPLELECNGVRIAILNFAENEFGTARQAYAGSGRLSPVENINAIRSAAQTADLVFVIIHGGHERNPMPSPRMVSTYRAFAEAGASMVMNIHTHCPEGIELWNGVPIIYSPGNLFFPWSDLTADHLSAMWWIGYIPEFHCDSKGVYALEIMPYRFNNKKLYELAPAEKTDFFDYLAEISRIITDPEEVRRYFEGWVARHGAFYLALLRDRLDKWPIDLGNREAVRDLLPVRNCFTCESHNDLFNCYLRLIEEKRVDRALEYWPRIERLQHPEWAEKYWREELKSYSQAERQHHCFAGEPAMMAAD